MPLSTQPEQKTPKPFLKWVGGKSQLISDIHKLITKQFSPQDKFNYIEPFVGGGAVLFHVLNCFAVENVIINDINQNLTAAYHIIKENPQELIKHLSHIKEQYYACGSLEQKKAFFLEKRRQFNEKKQLSLVEKTALLIFLNKTCFNGLYRVNKTGKFNVPFGQYEKPNICDSANITAVSHFLQNTVILNEDFEKTLNYAKSPCLFYLDPPYKPINLTSAFTAYAQADFADPEQVRLKEFCDKIAQNGDYFILSNSDLKNVDQENHFFETLYTGYHIQRVHARRSVNSKGHKRGKITELLITNIINPNSLC